MFLCFLPNEAYDLAWFESDSLSFAILSDTKSAKREFCSPYISPALICLKQCLSFNFNIFLESCVLKSLCARVTALAITDINLLLTYFIKI